MIFFRTEVFPGKSYLTIDYNTSIISIGSCFAVSMGQKLQDMKFNTCINPFGVVYNPISISNCFDYLTGEKKMSEDYLFFAHGLWHSFDFHSLFSGVNKQEVLETMHKTIEKAQTFLQNTNILIITLGTSWVYENKVTKRIVSNCHKLPDTHFNRYSLSIETITEKLNKIYTLCKKIQPQMQFLCTVSPIRHWKEGAHQNQLSKAKLLLAIQEFQDQHPDVFYFPAYEILLDDLRDYRFYNNDMLHPSELAIDYIWEKFLYSFTSEETTGLIEKVKQIKMANNHLIFNRNSAGTKKFADKQLHEIQEIEKHIPHADFAAEKKHFWELLE